MKPLSMYKRLQRLQAAGITIRRAGHFEGTLNEYGERLSWVIDTGSGRQALPQEVYRTKMAAVAGAEELLEPLYDPWGRQIPTYYTTTQAGRTPTNAYDTTMVVKIDALR